MQTTFDRFNFASYIFSKNDFMCVLYPFLCIFKLCGFLPLKLGNGQALRYLSKQTEWDSFMFFASVAAICSWILGYGLGVRKISVLQNWDLVRAQSTIAYLAIWLNIATTFLLGLTACVSSWWKMHDIRNCFALSFQVDQRFKHFNIKFDYHKARNFLLLVFLSLFSVPSIFSMINCVIVMPTSRVFNITSACYWFICFVPIFLYSVKEFQFVILLWLFTTKFSRINVQLEQYILLKRREKLFSGFMVQTPNSINDLSLSSSISTKLQVFEPLPTIDSIQKLLEIYSLAADGVELVLKAFSMHLLLSTTAAICIIIIQGFYLFAQVIATLSMQGYHIALIVVWLLLQIVMVAINISACNAAAKEMSYTATLLHKLRAQSSFESESVFYQIVQLFSMEVLQRKNNFTAAGYFDIDNRLITSIFSAVTTYLVILIQFHLANIKASS